MSNDSSESPNVPDHHASLSTTGCRLVLATAFLGWMCAGWQLAISSLAMRDAARDLLDVGDEGDVGAWFGRLICAFLLGAALGGYTFGWIGDRFGRAKAMAISILWYSIFSGLTVFVQEPWQLVLLRFLTCMGVGGMWPNGIALVSEAWPNISRPILAGAIGTAANLGILMLNWIGANYKHVTVDDWRWVMLFGASPVVLGIFVLVAVPESPRWLALQRGDAKGEKPKAAGLGDIFRMPILPVTILGIALGTIPLFGGWGSSNWASAWAASVGDPGLKARVGIARSLPGTISSLLGGGLATWLGRRKCYFILSLGALASAQYLFRFLTPDGDEFWFLFWFGMLGFFSGFFFGWLPLCLPELFPTRVRSTGAGVSFNWGRILTALGVLLFGEMLKNWFGGDYARIGQITSFIYAFGLAIVFFLPDTAKKTMDD